MMIVLVVIVARFCVDNGLQTWAISQWYFRLFACSLSKCKILHLACDGREISSAKSLVASVYSAASQRRWQQICRAFDFLNILDCRRYYYHFLIIILLFYFCLVLLYFLLFKINSVLVCVGDGRLTNLLIAVSEIFPLSGILMNLLDEVCVGD